MIPEYISNTFQKYWAPALAFIVAIIAATVAIMYAGQPLLERYEFRQTQTALTSYWMIKEGLRLDYLTPALGYPWSIPYEFPIYNALAAFISWAGAFPLDNVGRLLSFAFLIACGWPAYQIARRLDLNKETFWIFYALMLSSPLHLFWGRCFTIELAALFFTLMAIPYALDMRAPHIRWKTALLFVFYASLAALQKITTGAPAIVILGVIVFMSQIKNGGITRASWRPLLYLAIIFGIPLALGALWTIYTDFIKEQSLYGVEITSYSLREWNVGTLADRLSENGWARIGDRILTNTGGVFGVALAAICAVNGPRQIRTFILTCLALGFLPIMLFMPLHVEHNYYQLSSLAFLLAPLAVAIVWVSGKITLPGVKPALAVLFVAVHFYFFYQQFAFHLTAQFPPSKTYALAVGSVIKQYTPEDSVIVVYGNDWNSNIPYYAERKAFSAADYNMFTLGRGKGYHFKSYPLAWEHPEQFVGEKKISAVVFCPSFELNIEKITEHPFVKKDPSFFKVAECYVHLPGVKSITIPGTSKEILPGFQFDQVLSTLPEKYSKTSGRVCAARIDNINGVFDTPLQMENKVKDVLLVQGAASFPYQNIFVTLQKDGGTTDYIPVKTGTRHSNVINQWKLFLPNLGASSLPQIGFSTTIDVHALKGQYRLGMAIGHGNTFSRCYGTEIPVTIGAGR